MARFDYQFLDLENMSSHAMSLDTPTTTITAITDEGYCQPVIVIQTSNTAVINFARRMNASYHTAVDKWTLVDQTHASWIQVVDLLRSNPNNDQNKLAEAKQMVNALVFLRP